MATIMSQTDRLTNNIIMQIGDHTAKSKLKIKTYLCTVKKSVKSVGEEEENISNTTQFVIDYMPQPQAFVTKKLRDITWKAGGQAKRAEMGKAGGISNDIVISIVSTAFSRWTLKTWRKQVFGHGVQKMKLK